MLLYVLRVNAAFAAMNLDPTSVDGRWRAGMHMLGRSAGLTPQETALVAVALAMGIHRPIEVDSAVAAWRRRSKVDMAKPAVRDALADMGFAVDPMTSTFFGVIDDDLLDPHDPGDIYASSPIGRLFAERRQARIDAAVVSMRDEPRDCS